MKKIIILGIIILIICSAYTSISIDINKNADTINIDSKETYNDAFLNFMSEGLKEYISDYNETSFIRKTYMVPMRDGIKLATDVFIPIGLNKPHGCILLRTPYNKDDLTELGILLALVGWPTVIQDIRGMHASEGIYQGFRKCQTDGPDTLAWIASRDWSNGKVATVGPSALGITQYFTAGANPPELACQGIMVASPNLHKHAVYQGGEFRKVFVEKWLESVDASYLLPEIFEYENYSLDYWSNVSLDDNLDDINVPAIHLGGWYDIFLQGITDGYDIYQHLSGPGAIGKSKLIIGPWTHEGYLTYEQGQLLYPENSRKIVELILMFLEMAENYTMDIDNDFPDRANVWYYVMGDVDVIDSPGNEWRYANDWPIPADYISWYFHENGVLNKTYPSQYDPITYTYNPTDPVPTIGGQNLKIAAGPYDQTSIESRNDVLVFTSEILTQPLEITGPITARLFVSSDCPDTDFTVKLTDVYPDGRSMLITDGILRMRNRNGADHWEFMEPGEIYEIEVDIWSTSLVFNQGHRIRVAISSSNYPRFLANPNTVDAITKNTTFNIAQNTLYLDNDHPSCIILPEIKHNPPSSPPTKPSKPKGPRLIRFDAYHEFSSSATDPENNQVYILFDWGDGTSSGWLGPYDSGEKVNAIHKWTKKGTFQIRAKAKDVTDAQSDWSDPLSVTMLKDKYMNKGIIFNFLNKYKIFNNFMKVLYKYK